MASLAVQYFSTYLKNVGRNSVVGIGTRYGLDVPGIESRGGARFSAPFQAGPGVHPASNTLGAGSFPGVNRPFRGFDYHPHLFPFWSFVVCARVNFLSHKGHDLKKKGTEHKMCVLIFSTTFA